MENELGPLIAQVSTVLRQSEAASYAAGLLLIDPRAVNSGFTASAVAWLTYDIVLTIPLEIKHIWRREWSIPKIMFIFARYYALFFVCLIFSVGIAKDVPVKLCSAYMRMNGFGTQVLAYIVDGLLILRLHSVYGRRRSITIPLLLLYITQAIIEAVLVAVSTSTTKATPAPAIMSSWPGCFYDKPPRFVLAAWVPSLILQTILFAMTLYKLWELRVNGIKASGILNVFVRDGAMFFAMIFAATLMNALTAAIAPLPLLEVGGPWLIAIYGIATSRLILNLREYNDASTANTAMASRTQTGIELDFRRTHAEITARTSEPLSSHATEA